MGFDCIIGNPPYIRVQELNRWAPEECEFYKWKYASAAKGNYDIYVVFTEKALSLLSPDGLMGFIMPHKWWQAKYGEGLRKVIADGKHLRSIVDFTDQQVFKGATTYTAIHVLSKTPNNRSVDCAKVIDLYDGELQCRAIDAHRPLDSVRHFASPHPVGSGSWTFLDDKMAKFMAAVTAVGPSLGKYAEKIFVGLQTSADQVFLLEKRGDRYWSEQLQAMVELEETHLHPVLKGSVHMKRWVSSSSKQVVLFPYEEAMDGSYRLFSSQSLAMDSPLTWEYMKRCRPFLASRERGTFEGERWYGYVYPKNLARMGKRKLLTPSLGQRAEFSFDNQGELFFVGSGGGGGGGYGITLPDAAMYEYVLGLLNSRLLDWYLQQITTPFHSGWFAYSKQFIEQIPIKIPETSEEKKHAERIKESVLAIIDAKKSQRGPTLSDGEKSRLASTIEAHEKRIDNLVFRLYGVDGLPE